MPKNDSKNSCFNLNGNLNDNENDNCFPCWFQGEDSEVTFQFSQQNAGKVKKRQNISMLLRLYF